MQKIYQKLSGATEVSTFSPHLLLQDINSHLDHYKIMLQNFSWSETNGLRSSELIK